MGKRILSLCIGAFFLSCLVGCSEVYDLTDEETRLIAEYSADLLLKYDVSFEDRISEGEYKIEKKEENGEAVTTEVSEEVITTEEVSSEEETVEDDKGQNLNDMMDVTSDMTDNESVGREGDIAKLAGISDVSITYKDYLVTNQYPATDEDGKFIYLEASQGYELLVVRFCVKSNVEESVDVSLMDKGIDYKLVCNGKKAAKPMLTILMDDLGTLETTVNPLEEQEAVLIFQISDSIKDQLNNIELYINYNGADNVIDLL